MGILITEETNILAFHNIEEGPPTRVQNSKKAFAIYAMHRIVTHKSYEIMLYM